MDQKIHTTKNANETRSLGTSLGLQLKGGEVFCLYGQLGSGKTTFTQGLAKGLGIAKNITSPTFVLMRQYPMRNAKTFYHLDCYRLEDSTNMDSLGLKEIFTSSNNIICIEWPERIQSLLPENRIDIFFKNIGENKREIIIIND